MARKNRVSLAGDEAAEFNNPFANLRVEGLPAEGSAPATEAGPGPAPAGKVRRGRVVLRRETAHRGGKTVIVIDDFAPTVSTALIEELARRLRNACGCGGTTRQRSIELQGNQAARIRSFLEEEGFQVAGVK